MNAKFRNYTSKAGFSNDYHKVREFLIRINQEKVTTPNFLWGRWELMFSLPYLDKLSLSKIGLWEINNEIISLVTYESNLGKAYFCIDEDYNYLKKEMLEYAKKHLTLNDEFQALIPNNDREFSQIARQSELRPTQKKECVAVIDIYDSIQ